MERREFKFSTFVKVVVNQQLSDKASGTIYRRIYSLLDNRVTPGRFLKAKVADLRKCGISNQKIKNLKSIATVTNSDPRYFSRFGKEQARQCCQKLISLKGIGPWSASVITLFYIGHQDVLVEGDVTINKVVSRMYDIDIEEIPAKINIAYYLQSNFFGGRESVQLQIQDIA